MNNHYRHFSAVHGVPATAAHILKMFFASMAFLALLVATKAVLWMPFEPGHVLGDTLFKGVTSLVLLVLAVLWAAVLKRLCEEYHRPYLSLIPHEKRRMGKIDALLFPWNLRLQMFQLNSRRAIAEARIRRAERQTGQQR